VIALTGLVPAGLITAATNADATEYIPFMVADSTTQSASTIETPEPIAEKTDSQSVAEAEVPVPQAAPVPAAAPEAPPTPELPTSAVASPLGVPTVNVSAYKNAANILATTTPGCGIEWTLIAGIGRVESTHANDGKADQLGQLLEPILGPRLDGTLAGNNVIADPMAAHSTVTPTSTAPSDPCGSSPKPGIATKQMATATASPTRRTCTTPLSRRASTCATAT